MKLLSPEELHGHDLAVATGAAKGAFAGTAVAVPSAMLFHKYNGWYRSLTFSLRCWTVLMVVIPAGVIAAEGAGVRYARSRWTDGWKLELDKKEQQTRQKYSELSKGKQWEQWALKNQYSLVGGAWAATMAGSVAYVWHQKGQTTTQKLVQARMIAQAAALLLLCSAAYFSATHGVEGETKKQKADSSWKKTIAIQQDQDAYEREHSPATDLASRNSFSLEESSRKRAIPSI